MNELEIAIRLSREKGVGAAVFKRLMLENGLPSLAYEVWQKTDESLKEKLKVSRSKIARDDFIADTLKKIESDNYCGYYYSQEGYPIQFNDLGEPPPVIYTVNQFRQCRYAAVVGSRKATETQLEFARIKTLELIKAGFAIVSGGALGVDTIALKTALENEAYALAILGNALDVIYPKENKELFEELKNRGNLLTELMFGAQPQKGFFPTRNRLIAAIADVVIAIPGNLKSGSLITAKWAQKIGKKKVYIFNI